MPRDRVKLPSPEIFSERSGSRQGNGPCRLNFWAGGPKFGQGIRYTMRHVLPRKKTEKIKNDKVGWLAALELKFQHG